MSRFLLISALIVAAYALHPDLCRKVPKQTHCLIEYRVRYRWPHHIRYVYNWYTRSCFEIRWSNHCPPVPEPTTSNNFATLEECLDECGGWA